MDHPYRRQPAKAFWRKTVLDRDPLEVGDWYAPKFDIGEMRIASAGSCFAQHVGRGLKELGYHYVDVEPPPPFLPRGVWSDFSYGIYSARYGNIYSAGQLRQLLDRATGQFVPEEDYWVSEDGEGVVDAFRPTLEPEPFGSVAELREHRKVHLERVVELFRSADVWIFTLGLTEIWQSRLDGAIFPVCPGTAGGEFDPARHEFRNQKAAEVRQDLQVFLKRARRINPGIRMVLTVSPVSMLATATDAQVAVASTHCKSVLRGVAGEMAAEHDEVDYFPGYEIVTAPFMRGRFFEPNARNVTPEGVRYVMSVFAGQHRPPERVAGKTPEVVQEDDDADDVKCDEKLNDVFGRP